MGKSGVENEKSWMWNVFYVLVAFITCFSILYRKFFTLRSHFKKANVTVWHTKKCQNFSFFCIRSGRWPRMFFMILGTYRKQTFIDFSLTQRIQLMIFWCHTVTHGTDLRRSPHIMGHSLDSSGIHSKEYFSDTKKIFHYEGKVMHRRYIAIHIYVWALFGCAGDLVYKLLALRESKQIFGTIYFSFGRLCFERFFSKDWLIFPFLSEDEINDGNPGLIALSEGSTQYSCKAHILSFQLWMVAHW